ncbi:MAG: thioredoxin family protein [Victivallales bacterium]|nr:thioredoxin family protein [Victivallales bacterium]
MLKVIVVLLIGAGIGALMGYFGKCADGTCPLTANPYRGAAWGLFLAGIVAYPMLLNAFRKPVPPSTNIIHVKDSAEFAATIAKGVCLVDFYADWCGPCRTLSPTINKLADDHKGRVKVLKINVDNFGELARQYNANSIPNVVIFQNGTEVERIIGARSYDTYVAALEKQESQ